MKPLFRDALRVTLVHVCVRKRRDHELHDRVCHVLLVKHLISSRACTYGCTHIWLYACNFKSCVYIWVHTMCACTYHTELITHITLITLTLITLTPIKLMLITLIKLITLMHITPITLTLITLDHHHHNDGRSLN